MLKKKQVQPIDQLPKSFGAFLFAVGLLKMLNTLDSGCFEVFLTLSQEMKVTQTNLRGAEVRRGHLKLQVLLQFQQLSL